MTILIAGTVDILDGGREKALSEAASLMAETRSQGGCKHYVCWASKAPTIPTFRNSASVWKSRSTIPKGAPALTSSPADITGDIHFGN